MVRTVRNGRPRRRADHDDAPRKARRHVLPGLCLCVCIGARARVCVCVCGVCVCVCVHWCVHLRVAVCVLTFHAPTHTKHMYYYIPLASGSRSEQFRSHQRRFQGRLPHRHGWQPMVSSFPCVFTCTAPCLSLYLSLSVSVVCLSDCQNRVAPQLPSCTDPSPTTHTQTHNYARMPTPQVLCHDVGSSVVLLQRELRGR